MILPFPLSLSISSIADNLSDLEKKKLVEAKIQSFEKDFKAPQISAAKLKDLLKNNPSEIVLVDVRTKHEQKVSMLKGAITRDEFLKNTSAYKGKTVVSYCTIGYRSSMFTEKLVKEGVKAFNLRGSLLLWTHTGGKLYKQSGKQTKKVHVYGKEWDLVPASYDSEY